MGGSMEFALSSMKVSVVIQFQMDKQIDGREEKVLMHTLTHTQIYYMIKAPFWTSNIKNEDRNVKNEDSNIKNSLLLSLQNIVPLFLFLSHWLPLQSPFQVLSPPLIRP